MPEKLRLTDRRFGSRWLAPALLFAAGAALLPWLVHPWYDYTWDGAVYLQCARSLLRGEGYAASGIPFIHRPPGLSLLLAPLLAGGLDFQLINAATSLFGLLGGVLLFLWARPRLGGPAAAAVAAALWLNPAYQRWANQPMSDIPGLVFLLGILITERRSTRTPSLPQEVLLGALIGAGALVRTIVLLAVPAIWAARFLAARRAPPVVSRPAARGLLVFPAVALLILFPWSIHKSKVPAEEHSDQFYAHGYVTALLREDFTDPASAFVGPRTLLDRARQNGAKLLGSLDGMLDTPKLGVRGLQTVPWLGILLAASLLTVAVRRREAADFTVLLLFALYAGNYTYLNRYALPIYAFALCALADVIRAGAQRLSWGRAGTIFSVLLLATILVRGGNPRSSWQEIREEHESRDAVFGALDKQLPEHARVGVWYSAPLYGLLLDRPAFNFKVAFKHKHEFLTFEQVIKRRGIDVVLVKAEDRSDFRSSISGFPLLFKVGPFAGFDVRGL